MSDERPERGVREGGEPRKWGSSREKQGLPCCSPNANNSSVLQLHQGMCVMLKDGRRKQALL